MGVQKVNQLQIATVLHPGLTEFYSTFSCYLVLLIHHSVAVAGRHSNKYPTIGNTSSLPATFDNLTS